MSKEGTPIYSCRPFLWPPKSLKTCYRTLWSIRLFLSNKQRSDLDPTLKISISAFCWLISKMSAAHEPLGYVVCITPKIKQESKTSNSCINLMPWITVVWLWIYFWKHIQLKGIKLPHRSNYYYQQCSFRLEKPKKEVVAYYLLI